MPKHVTICCLALMIVGLVRNFLPASRHTTCGCGERATQRVRYRRRGNKKTTTQDRESTIVPK